MRLKTEVVGKSSRSLKAYLVSSRCARMMCAIWKARIAFRLPICCAPSCVTTPVVSSRPFEMMMVLPTAIDSSGSVSRVRHADRAGERDVVIGQDVARQRFQRLVELAWRVEQTGLEETLHDVVFRLLDPCALGAQRADVGGVVADVGRADDIHRGVLRLWWRDLQHIAPDVVDRFELQSARGALRVALFYVEGGRQPEVRLYVRAPAVEVVVLAHIPSRCRKSRR